jgi:hypothetical protein
LSLISVIAFSIYRSFPHTRIWRGAAVVELLIRASVYE